MLFIFGGRYSIYEESEPMLLSSMSAERHGGIDERLTVPGCTLLGASPSQRIFADFGDEQDFRPAEPRDFELPAPTFQFPEPATPSRRLSLKRKLVEFASRRHTLDPGHFNKLPKTPAAPQVHSRRPQLEVLRERANSFASPDIGAKTSKSMARSISSKSLVGGLRRKGSSKKRKSSKSFFGSPCKRTNLGISSMWLETLKESQAETLERLGRSEVKRQEAIYELTLSESVYASDLGNVLKVYLLPMLTLKLITPTEQQAIFCNLQQLAEIHAQLSSSLDAVRSPTHGVVAVADILLGWLPQLGLYGKYCANQAFAKHTLEQKQRTNDSVLKDLLESAGNLKLSRRMDLWTFLDAPRRRLQRYPILLRAISKYTSDTNEKTKMDLAADQCEAIIREVDQMVETTGRQKLLSLQESLEFAHGYQKVDLIQDNQPLLTVHDVLGKDGKGLRLHVFAHLLLITKDSKHKATDSEPMRTVVGRPIKMEFLEIEDCMEQQLGLIGRSRSFRGRAQLQANSCHPQEDLEEDSAADLVVLRNCDPCLQRGSFRGHKTLQRLPTSSGKAYSVQLSTSAEKAVLLEAVTRAKLEWNFRRRQLAMTVAEDDGSCYSPSGLNISCV